MKRNPVGWFELYVQDMPRAKAFYEAVFETKLERLDDEDGSLEMWAFPGNPDAVGTAGSLVRMPGFPSGGNSTIVYFTCEDCANEGRRAAANGGKIFKDKFSIGEYGFIVLLTDPEGNMIGLHSMK